MKEKKQTETITSLDELQALLDKPMHCEFVLDRHSVKLECKRLSAAIEEEVRRIRRDVQPPWSAEKKDYDHLNSQYLQKRDAAERIARSVIVYWGCPQVAAKKPGLIKPAEIHLFVNGLLTEHILELLALTVQAGGLEVPQRTDFT
jgi:hypothetical protein